MAVLLAALAGLVVGALAGGLVTARLLGRRQPAAAPPAPVAAPAPRPEAAAAAPARAPVPASADEPDPDLKPVLDATRGVVSELEHRYQGARATGDGETRKPRPPRRRT